MKNLIVLLSLLVMSFGAFAAPNTKSIKKVAKQSTSFFDGKKNYFFGGVGFGLGSTEVGDKTKMEFTANQMNFEAGVSFGLPYNIRTTSIFGYHLINTNDDDLLKELNVAADDDIVVDAFRSHDFSLRQRLQYTFEFASFDLMPYTELGIAFGGNYYEISSEKRKASQSVSWGYNRLIFAFGTEVRVGNLLPYVRFAFSDVNYSEESEYEIEQNGKTQDGTTKHTSAESDGSQFMAALGVSYRI